MWAEDKWHGRGVSSKLCQIIPWQACCHSVGKLINKYKNCKNFHQYQPNIQEISDVKLQVTPDYPQNLVARKPHLIDSLDNPRNDRNQQSLTHSYMSWWRSIL